MILPYIGGKSKFSNFITPYIPQDVSTFVEPFGGMMGVFLSLDPIIYNFDKVIYNDLNFLNYNLFNKLKCSDFILDLNNINIDESFYKNSLELISSEKDLNKLAIYWLVILCCSNPYEIGKNSWRDNSKFKLFKERIDSYSLKLNNITDICNEDYKDIIKKYDSVSTLFYVDPPYFGKEDYYINHNFYDKSHTGLASILNNIDGRFILSYFYFDGIKDLYPNCNFVSKKTIIGTEWLIMNY